MNYPNLGEICFGLIFILCTYLCWYYWKLVQSFKGFPTYTVEMELIFRVLSRRFPKGTSFTSLILNELLIAWERFQEAGLFLFWFFQPVVVILKEEYVKMLLNDKTNVDKPIFYKVFSEMVGDGLLTHNGFTWRKHRKLIDPAFRLKVIKGQLNTLNHIAKDIVEQVSESCDNPSSEVSDILQASTLKAICEFAFGLKMHDKKYDKKYIEVGKNIQSLETYTVQRFTRPWLYLKHIQLFFEEGRQHKKCYKKFENFTKWIITEMTNSSSVHTSETNETEDVEFSGKKLNNILVENLSKDSSFTMRDMEGEVRTILTAGHNPSFTGLLWCLFLLGLHSDVQEKAFEEVQSVTGSSDGDISYNETSQLKYLESVIKETLRIYPVVPVFARKTNREIKCGKYKIPKNTCILFCSYLLHRNPNIYPDPEKFDPERFYGDLPKHPWAFIPFAEGNRTCIGKNLAMLEMKIFLAHILKNFKITSLDKREDVELDWSILLKPVKPLRFKFTRR